MNTVLTLDETHYLRIAAKSRAVGKTPEQYVQALIDADDRSIDEILAPVRAGFEGMDDAALEGLLGRAKRAVRDGE